MATAPDLTPSSAPVDDPPNESVPEEENNPPGESVPERENNPLGESVPEPEGDASSTGEPASAGDAAVTPEALSAVELAAADDDPPAEEAAPATGTAPAKETGAPTQTSPAEKAASPTEPVPVERTLARFGAQAPRALIAAGLLLAVVVPLLLAIVSGAISIPHHDAWSYSRIGQHFGEGGGFDLLGWNRPSLIGQIVVLGPLAGSIAAQQVLVALLGAVALFACYDLLTPTIGRIRAGLATLVLACWPELGLLSTSFMTDVPALAGALGCLALGRRALAKDSPLLLAAALVVGLWGATVRESVLAAPAALLAVALLRAVVRAWNARSRERLRWLPLLGFGAAFAAAWLGFEYWRRGLPDDGPVFPAGADIIPPVLGLAVSGYFMLALAASPVILLFARPSRWTRTAWFAAGATAIVAALVWHDHGRAAFLFSDYLTPLGPYPGAVLGQRSMLPDPLFEVAALLAAFSGVVLAGVLVGRIGQLPPLLGWFSVLTVGGLLVGSTTGQPMWGRDLVVLIPLLLCVVLTDTVRVARRPAWLSRIYQTPPPAPRRAWSRAGLVFAVPAVALLAALGLLTTAYGTASDTARWEAGEALAETGVPRTEIDAGFEWVGYHSADGFDRAPRTDRPNWYADQVPGSRPCFVVAVSEQHRAGWRLVRTVEYQRYVIAGSAQLWIYDTGRCG
ncbi:hypothetical protein ACI2K4_27585 [Micromonospora sp. NPDC050397]|uniref:hypothetical protein n=1 Tax=Micromonospora sp. NPDC050397 TaxID=3364279 RepID=UPI00384EA874